MYVHVDSYNKEVVYTHESRSVYTVGDNSHYYGLQIGQCMVLVHFCVSPYMGPFYYRQTDKAMLVVIILDHVHESVHVSYTSIPP